MPIIIDNFFVNNPNPIDNRFVVGTSSFYSNKDLIQYKYTGLRIWDLNDGTPYVWTGTTWLSDNYDPVLFYGAMREAMIFMKGEADMVGYYEQKYQEALGQLKRLGDGLERGDSYRNNQTKLPYSSL